jgi:hypothetical protein
MKYIDYLFEVVGEDSDLCGEEFFVEVVMEEDYRSAAWEIAIENFPNEELRCLGAYPPALAEAMGYDTY